MSVFLRAGSREDLEREVARAVKRDGYCYAHDHLLTEQLGATSPEQVVAWEQSFCERSGLTCRPYKEDTSPDGRLPSVRHDFQSDRLRRLP